MNQKVKFEPKLRLKDRLYSLLYRLLRSEASNGLRPCSKCKKRKRQINDWLFKPEYLIGYDKVLGEWVIFSEYNTYAKIWAINGYVVRIFTLHEKLWEKIGRMCRLCMTEHFETYVEPGDGENEAG